MIGWSTIDGDETGLQTNVIFDADAQYCAGDARDILTDRAGSYKWTITDKGSPENCAGNANLSALSIDPGLLTPSFDFATTSYTATVSSAVDTLTVTPTANDVTNATITVNGTAVNSGAESNPISLGATSNTITVMVTAQNRTMRTYSIAVYKELEIPDMDDRTFTFTEGRTIESFMLSEATGGSGSYDYTVEGLPESLTFATMSLVISGIPDVLGTFVIEYTASDADTTVATILEPAVQTFAITVNGPPVAMITVGDHRSISGAPPDETFVFLEGDTVALDGSGSSDPEGEDLTYKWTATSGLSDPTPANSFSDSTAANTSLRLPDLDPGGIALYTITLVVTDASDLTAQTQVNIGSAGRVMADAGEAQTVNRGETVALDGRLSINHGGSLSGDPLTYSWVQVGEPPVALTNANTSMPTFTAPTVTMETDLVFRLTITSMLGDSDTDTVAVTVNAAAVNAAPTADAGSSQIAVAGMTVTLDGSGSRDTDGDVLRYSWIQVGEPPVSLSDASVVSPTFTAPNVATSAVLTFRLTVTDASDATDSATVTIAVYNPVMLERYTGCED